MTGTAEQIQALMQEMQRMSARLQTAEQAAADAGRGSSKLNKPQVRPRTEQEQQRGSKWLQEVTQQAWWTPGLLED
eukprot:1362003-Amphidinium_carterae.1